MTTERIAVVCPAVPGKPAAHLPGEDVLDDNDDDDELPVEDLLDTGSEAVGEVRVAGCRGNIDIPVLHSDHLEHPGKVAIHDEVIEMQGRVPVHCKEIWVMNENIGHV